ncbi:MAG TPA: hypothetical protein VIG25_06635, partial [Pyrinomonadaceae bacterium]
SQQNKPGLYSLNEMLISDGLPIFLSRSATSQSELVVTIDKNGGYFTREKVIEKARLRTEMTNRLRTKPSTDKVLFVKADPVIKYGDFEDLYYEAFAAGVTAIYLDIGERTIAWADQEIAITLPAGWHKRDYENERFSLDGPDQGRLKIEVVTSKDIQVEKNVEADHNVALNLQREGAVDEVQYLLVDGAKGTLTRRKAKPGRPISLQWVGYRTWKGKQQFISILMDISPNDRVDRQQELMNILQSTHLSALKD